MGRTRPRRVRAPCYAPAAAVTVAGCYAGVRAAQCRHVRRVDLVAVDRVIADLELLVGEAHGMKIPTTFRTMNVTTAVYAITHTAASACQRSSVQPPPRSNPVFSRQVSSRRAHRCTRRPRDLPAGPHHQTPTEPGDTVGVDRPQGIVDTP